MSSVPRTDQDKSFPYIALAQGMAGVPTEKIITDQEKQGQRDLVNSDVLPSEILHDRDGNIFAGMGIVLGDVVPNDPLFRYVRLPEGWKKQSTSHDMWSTVVDQNGRERIAVFYKAAFYDRKAHMSPVRRFLYSTDYDEPYYTDYNSAQCGCVIEKHTDGTDRKIWRSEPGDHADTRDLGKAWLDEHFPDWENYLAYWDLPPTEFTGYTIAK